MDTSRIAKTHVLAKPHILKPQRRYLKVVISIEGERYLSGTVGTSSFVRQYVERRRDEGEKLSKIAETQPHAAYSAFTHGLSSKWNYLLRVTD